MQKEVLTCFKAYDIRGRYPEEINEAIVYRIGRAFVLHAKTKKVFVGRDMRVSSPKLTLALMNGLRDQGATVVDLGLVSTPMLYLASKNGDAMMVTASHNPKEYNGIKVARKGVKLVGDKELKKIESIVLKNKFPDAKRGKLIRKSILKSYIEHVMESVKYITKKKVVIDAGNGMAALTIPKLLEKLPIEAHLLDFTLDGRFPNHTPNPVLHENIKDCIAAVKKHHASLGVSFDGDMDRVAFIDENGRAIPADIILALLAKYELQEFPKKAVVFDLRASRSVRNAIFSAGGVPTMCRVGHTFIVNKMRKTHAILGGELSGHFYFKQNNYVESADIAFVKVLNILSRTDLPLSALVSQFYQYERSGELSFTVTDKTQVLKAIAYAFEDAKKSRLDGLTVEYPDAWFNVRASQTEPLIRVVIEASTRERLEKLKKKVMKLLV
jgi:phosphomannomutase